MGEAAREDTNEVKPRGAVLGGTQWVWQGDHGQEYFSKCSHVTDFCSSV